MASTSPRWLLISIVVLFVAFVGLGAYTVLLQAGLSSDITGVEDRLSADLTAAGEKLSTDLAAADERLSAADDRLSANLTAAGEKLSTDLAAVDVRLSAADEGLSSELTSVDQKLSTELARTAGSLSDQLKARADELVAALDTLETALSAEVSDTAVELRGSIQSVRTRLDNVRTELTTADTALDKQLTLQGAKLTGDLDSLSTSTGVLSTNLARVSADLDALEDSTSNLMAQAARALLDVAPLYNQVKDSVVEILESGQLRGSGFVYGAGGNYVVTAWHVVDGASSISVRLSNGTEIAASVAGKNIVEDVAVLRLVQAAKVSPLPLADYSQLVVGQPVLVVGSPFTLTGTATTGIISALDRDEYDIFGIAGMTNMVQIDAATNPGNSGGPVFNADGEVVGIVSWGLSDGDDSGLNFLISSITIKTLTDSIIGK